MERGPGQGAGRGRFGCIALTSAFTSIKWQVRMYGITAITHYNGARAWRVTLYRAGAKQVEKEFPFLSHGGELQALAKAQAFRDEQMILHPPQLSRDVRSGYARPIPVAMLACRATESASIGTGSPRPKGAMASP